MLSISMELDNVTPQAEYWLVATAADLESLLVNWLSEVLYWHDGKQIAFCDFRVTGIDSTRVRGIGLGEPRDHSRHRAKLIVKAVTYHQLKVAQTPEGWVAEVYLDI